LKPLDFLSQLYDFSPNVEVYRRLVEEAREMDPDKYYSLPEEAKNYRVLNDKTGLDPIDPGTVIARIAMVPVEKSVRDFAANEAFWRASVIMTALRLHEAKNGRLPEKLEELGELVPKELLIDPFSGKQLVYRIKDGDFCLYSVGVNGLDEKCEDTREPFRTNAEEDEPDDIIFHAPRKKSQ
jgi:hypothetical protein